MAILGQTQNIEVLGLNPRDTHGKNGIHDRTFPREGILTMGIKVRYTSEMSAMEGVQRRFERYARDEDLVAKQGDVRVACATVLRTVHEVAEGQCNFSTARRIVRMFKTISLHRDWEAAAQAVEDETQRLRDQAIPWWVVLSNATGHQREGVDDPAELRRNLLRELAVRNLVFSDDEQLSLDDLSIR